MIRSTRRAAMMGALAVPTVAGLAHWRWRIMPPSRVGERWEPWPEACRTEPTPGSCSAGYLLHSE